MSETREYQVQAKALRLANAFTSKDTCRPALQNVHVNGDRLEGCDGHIGVTVRVAVEAQDSAAPVLIPSDSLKPIKAKDGMVRLSVNGDGMLAAGQTQTIFTPAEGPYPDFQKVYPSGEPVLRIGVDPKLAARTFKAIADYLNDEWDSVVTVSLYGPDKAIRIQAGAGDHVDVLLMPKRK